MNQDKLLVTLTEAPLETTEFSGNISRVTLNGQELLAKKHKGTRLLICAFGIFALSLGFSALYLGVEIKSSLDEVLANQATVEHHNTWFEKYPNIEEQYKHWSVKYQKNH